MAESSKKAALVSRGVIDSNARRRRRLDADERAWGYCQSPPTPPPLPQPPLSTVAFVQVIMKRVREACSGLFSFGQQNNPSCQHRCRREKS